MYLCGSISIQCPRGVFPFFSERAVPWASPSICSVPLEWIPSHGLRPAIVWEDSAVLLQCKVASNRLFWRTMGALCTPCARKGWTKRKATHAKVCPLHVKTLHALELPIPTCDKEEASDEVWIACRAGARSMWGGFKKRINLLYAFLPYRFFFLIVLQALGRISLAECSVGDGVWSWFSGLFCYRLLSFCYRFVSRRFSQSVFVGHTST